MRSAALLGISLILSGCATLGSGGKPIDVTVEVDFGPARKPLVRQVVSVQPPVTAELAVAQLFPLEKGSVCCDPREIAAIDGIAADPATNRWWSVSVNGSRKVSPYRTRLKAGDVVRWEYRRYDQ
jgi:hypothetical protein